MIVGALRSLIKSVRASSKLEADINRRVQAIYDFIPIEDTHPDDVFVIGYPRSGSTWVRMLLLGVVYGLDPEYLPFNLVDDLIPDIHSARRYYRRYCTPTYFKSHDLPRPAYRRVIYLLRDGRDVMVSYFHFLSALNANSEIDFARMVRNGQHLFPGKWHEHVNAWRSNPYRAQMVTLKYEELLKDPAAQLSRICQFLNLARPASLIESVVVKSSFSNLRAKEEKLGSWQKTGWAKDKFFIRRGAVGSYKDEMPRQVLDLFLADAAETLRACAYL